jgi:ABC-type multidrug transport system ATPase subunit
VLRASDIAKSYGRRRVLDHVALDLYPGMLVGVVGENGAGKSTLLRILSGDLRPDSGAVRIAGALGYCPQAVTLNDALTVDQHLDYFRAAYEAPDLTYATKLVERLGYTSYRRTPAGALSGGVRQKLNLTLALLRDPTILLLDEPYQGFDWETYLHFWELATDLRQRGRAILIISHLLFDQGRFDTIYQLNAGRLETVKPAAIQAASATARV